MSYRIYVKISMDIDIFKYLKISQNIYLNILNYL